MTGRRRAAPAGDSGSDRRVLRAYPSFQPDRNGHFAAGVPQGVTRKTLRLTGEERIDISNLQSLQPGATVPVTLTRADGSQEAIPCRCRIDTATELTYYRNDGILHYVIRNML